jgi:hypothetical protein
MMFRVNGKEPVMSSMMRRRLAVVVVVTVTALSLPGTAWAAAPSLPLALTATAGSTEVALAWTIPSETGGGGGIDTYQVEYSSTGGSVWTRVVRADNTAVAYTVTGLTNGIPYTFRVMGVNGSDVGPASATAAATPVANYSPTDAATYSACPTGVIPVAGFSDTTSTDVDCIAYYGITKGTTATTYSPTDTVTRWQMALFLTRMATRAGVTLGDGPDQGFADIAGYSTEIQTAVNQIKQLGITVGKTATTYAPADTVTREEMALFITRLLKKATVGPGGNEEFVTGSTGLKEIKSLTTNFNFTDINQGTYEIRDAIINLWNLGVTDVQTVTTFEPTLVMSRKAMATFMARALAHTNARPKGLILQPSSYRLKTGYAVTLSATHRADDFSAIAGSSVDTFRFNHSLLSTVVRFDQSSNVLVNGACTTAISASTVGNIKCKVDAADPKTDANGNLAVFSEIPPTVNKVDVWAWTAADNTVYDNNTHAAAASKITVETYP